MKTLRRVTSVLILTLFMVGQVRAEDYLIPQDRNGNIPSDINLIGVDIFTATGTAAIGSTTPVVLYGFTVSSDALTNTAFLRDTNTLNTTSNIKLSLYQEAECTTAVQTCNVRLPVPVLFRNGLSINLASAVAAWTVVPNRSRWMFYVRYMREGSVTGKTPTQDDPRISVDNLGVN